MKLPSTFMIGFHKLTEFFKTLLALYEVRISEGIEAIINAEEMALSSTLTADWVIKSAPLEPQN